MQLLRIYIINCLGIISIPSGFLSFICVPDAPSNTRAFWLRPRDRKFGRMRAKAFGRAEPKKFTIRRFIHVVISCLFLSPSSRPVFF